MSVKTSVASVLCEGETLRIVYKDHRDEVTERCIRVERIFVAGNGATCVVAHCYRRGERRTFDAARILAAMPDTSTALPATFGPSPEQAAAAAWMPWLVRDDVWMARA